MSDDGSVSIGQAAARSGVSAKAIRLYEARGLLPTTARTATGHRVFDAGDLEVLNFITRAKSAGLRLSEIKTVLEIQRAGRAPCGHVLGLLDDRVAEIDSTMRSLSTLRQRIIELRDRTDRGLEQSGLCSILSAADPSDGLDDDGRAR
ncbi:DNA-binding transcriptional MerR regulator [Pseudonocardia sediminis]|uniref:DNA-binding transcriptional MerR regulator n=1 Tax=Pseudonocardia sediminis TaxID=1397368 RepID=A0A4V2FQS9_PSEST|nr:MerR family transcriptional regulator [Pseudonocardia sediminis]RZT85590.1 DNA-binding transcriptional MerR regulator [Pseudonocardia sediminis]